MPINMSFDSEAHRERLVVVDEQSVVLVGTNPFQRSLPASSWTRRVLTQVDRETGEFIRIDQSVLSVDSKSYYMGTCTRVATTKWMF